jgi:trehalose/maltose hydrolase-like predicted phosphorylase
MRDYGGKLSFHPRMAMRGSALGLRFRLTVRDHLLEVDFDREKKQVTYLLLEGTALEIAHEGEDLRLKPNEPVHREIKLI